MEGDEQGLSGGRLVESGLTVQDAVIGRSLALVCRGLFSERSALLSIGRFELVRTLGRGATGTVYEAFDPVRREHVALKVLHGQGPTHLFRLKREFRALSGLSHPNLVALHELSIEDGEAYLSMDLVRGRDFVAYASHCAAVHEPGAAEALLRSALAQLCEGVHALHGAGKLHRDLKPTNILVTDAGHVVLLDFGLVEDALGGNGYREGTPGYMAPEQDRGRACEASDWYAFGRVLQESLRGRHARSSTSRALEQLALRLLHPEAARRPGYAEIIAALEDRLEQAPSRAPRAPSTLPFVGRKRELNALADAYARSRKQPVMVLVRGEWGIGKSALLRHFARTALEPSGALVLSGRCYEGESVPYKALDSAIDALSMHLLTRPGAGTSALRPSDCAALLQVFPVLGRVTWLRDGAVKLEGAHPVELRARAFTALKQLLARLALERPLVLQIEDLQWSDTDSGRLLGALLCDEDSPAVLVIASDRTDPRLLRPALDELRNVSEQSPYPLAVEQLELGGLDVPQATELARALIDGANEGRTERVVAESRGNPLFVAELSRWVASGRAEHTGELPTLDALFAERMRPLSQASRSLLASIALTGQPLPLRVLARAAELGSELYAQLKELRRARVVHATRRGAEDLVEIAHDRLSDVALHHVGAAARAARRVRLARAFEAELGEGCEAPIELYLAANRPLEAAQRARKAAGIAFATLAFARASALYSQALELGIWSRDERADILHAYGRALEHHGRGLAAARAYAHAARLTDEPHAAAQLQQRAALHLMHNGRWRRGEALLRRGYAALGLYWPRSRIALLFAIIWLLLPLRLRQLVRRDRSSDALRRARAELLSGAGRGLQNYDIPRAILNALICFDESEQLPDPVWHARALGARGIARYFFSPLPGSKARGIDELERACKVATEYGDPAAEADLYLQWATAQYFGEHPRAALEAVRRSEAHLRAIPHNPTDLHSALGVAGAALVDLGELREARRLWSASAHEARVHGDLVTSTFVHANPLQLAPLFAAEEHEHIQQILTYQARLSAGHPRFHLLAWAHAVCRVEHALFFGTAEHAIHLFARYQRELLRSGHPVLTASARMVRARARVAIACTVPRGAARERWLRAAARDAAAARKHSGVVQRGSTLLVEAGIARLRGQNDLALARLDSILTVMDAAGAKLVAACARHCRGALLGGEQGAALMATAESTLRDEGVACPARWIAWTACGFRDDNAER